MQNKVLIKCLPESVFADKLMVWMSHDLADLLDDDKENNVHTHAHTHTHTCLDMAAAAVVSFLKHSGGFW